MNIDINYIDGTSETRCDVSDFSINDGMLAIKFEDFTAYCNMRHIKSYEVTEDFDLGKDLIEGMEEILGRS